MVWVTMSPGANNPITVIEDVYIHADGKQAEGHPDH